MRLFLTAAAFLFCATLVRAEDPYEIANRKMAAGAEVASLLERTTSPDGRISILFTARKKTVKAAKWPEVIADFSPKMSDAIHDEGHVIENVVVCMKEKLRIGTVKSATKGWSPYWGASKADFQVLWGPEQEGWYYGVLCYNVGFGCDDLILVDVDGTSMRQVSIMAPLEAAARKFSLKKVSNPKDYRISFQLVGHQKIQGVSSLLDPLTVRINYTFEIPKSEAETFNGTMTVKLARSEQGPTTATVLGIKPGSEEPDQRPDPVPELPAPTVPAAPTPATADLSNEAFAKFRKEVNAKTETKVWKEVTKTLPNTEKDRRLYVKGWLEGNVLQRLMYVDSRSDDNESITFYYWRDGQLTSVFQVRTGPMTRLEGVTKCTETYNFSGEKLISWRHASNKEDIFIDTKTKGFADASKRVLEESLKYSQPIYSQLGVE